MSEWPSLRWEQRSQEGGCMDQVIGTIVGRWYVTSFGLAFLYFGWRLLGARKLLIYSVVSVALAALAENASVHWGIPYTTYAFNESLRSQELWLFDVPLMVPLSYSFVMFFAFAAARLVASGPWRTVPPSPTAAYASRRRVCDVVDVDPRPGQPTGRCVVPGRSLPLRAPGVLVWVAVVEPGRAGCASARCCAERSPT